MRVGTRKTCQPSIRPMDLSRSRGGLPAIEPRVGIIYNAVSRRVSAGRERSFREQLARLADVKVET